MIINYGYHLFYSRLSIFLSLRKQILIKSSELYFFICLKTNVINLKQRNINIESILIFKLYLIILYSCRL